MKKFIKKVSAALLIFFMLCSCAQPQTEDKPEEDFDDNQTPVVANTPIPVEKTSFYEDISPIVTLAEYDSVEILDIAMDKVLFQVQTRLFNANGDVIDGGLQETTSIFIYNLDTGKIITQEELSGVCVFHGALAGDGFVYSAFHLGKGEEEPTTGYVRRVGTDSSWEYALHGIWPDYGVMPKPFLLPSDEIAFIECHNLYYEGGDENTISTTLFEEISVRVVSPDGTVRTIFTPDADRFMGDTWIYPYDEGYMFLVWTDEGYILYKGNETAAEPMVIVDDCRAIYAWWVAVDGGFLFSVGYGDDSVGITSKKNVFVKENGESVVLENRIFYVRLTSDYQGRIVAIDESWNQYLLEMDNETLLATRIDLPNGVTDFYSDGNGNLYAYLSNLTSDDFGLYQILK